MSPYVERTGRAEPATSLRTRWNRAFGVLTFTVAVAGIATLVGTQLLVGTFRDSAMQLERQSTRADQLRSDIVVHLNNLTAPASEALLQQQDAATAAVRNAYEAAIAGEPVDSARASLVASQADYEVLVDAAGPPESPADAAARQTAVALGSPRFVRQLDEAGALSRAAVRADLASTARLERGLAVALVVLELLVVAMALRLARLLSREVLRPVSVLCDSANHLADGELDHRVVVDRNDELGELALSFNAMADAIEGSQRSLTREATTDSLSELANRAAFYARLEATLARPNRRDARQAVLFVDLDDFKDVNDTMGHAAGDELLRVVAGRLRDAVRPGDLAARLGGDEFALLLEGLPDVALAETIAQRVVRALAEPVQVRNSWAHVGASVGLSLRDDESTVDGLTREADIAMYAAKGKGKNRVQRFHPGLLDGDGSLAGHSTRAARPG